jgi:hypothetical protein
MADGRDIQIHYADNWAALYVDGKLHRDRHGATIGDSHNVEETLFELLGVTVAQDDSFLLGQDRRDGAATTLEEIEEYRAARRARADVVAEMREQAAKLVREADALASRPLS